MSPMVSWSGPGGAAGVADGVAGNLDTDGGVVGVVSKAAPHAGVMVSARKVAKTLPVASRPR